MTDRDEIVTPDPTAGDLGTRAEHLAWCKMRALQYVDRGDVNNAFASFCSDLNKHSGTRGHIAQELGMMQMMSGFLNTPQKMREWIEGTR
jgi:hypothetical protein